MSAEVKKPARIDIAELEPGDADLLVPDAYEGAPTPVTAFMAAAVKAAAIAAMIRVFGVALGGDVLPFGTLGWASPLVVIAAITITIGNITAVRQDNIKRMLAYSSISHAGVLLVGLCALGLGSTTGAERARLLPDRVQRHDDGRVRGRRVRRLEGPRAPARRRLGRPRARSTRRAALAMTICLLSLGGMPPTGGFFGKFYVFKCGDGRLQRPAAVARHRRRRQLGDQHLLLPAHRHRDVLPRGRTSRSRRRARRASCS